MHDYMRYDCNYFICAISLIRQMLRVFIIGTTGVGKTKLSIELAKYLKGEIISSDSKQLYKHATIMTAKVTEEQAEGVPHHMVDALELHQNAYNRNKYFSEAFAALQQIEMRGKIPIIVGGTNYYTETLLYELNSLSKVSQSQSESEGDESSEEEKGEKELQEVRKLSKEEKYELLKKYDSVIAEKVHKNNQQKISLFLERMIKNKSKISENYQQLTHHLRSSNTIVFWLRNSDKDELLAMITKRIHKMLDKAGISEIFAVYHYLHLHRAAHQIEHPQHPINYEQYSGAASSIGIKQFLPLYLQVRSQLLVLLPSQHEQVSYEHVHDIISKHLDELTYSQETLAQCRQQLIMDTKHYCKRQITWIRNRMFLHTDTARQHFFVLDLQQKEGEPMEILERFELQIKKRALEIIESARKYGFGHILEQQSHFAHNKAIPLEQWKNYYCEPCKVEINGEFDWSMHLKSKKHIKTAKYEEKKEEREKYIAQQKALAKERREKKEKEALSQQQDQKQQDQ